ncbi:hypothetical protein GFM14_24610 [Rhizobium leguminosarum bv. viciae]|uniref:cytochrome P460 family protein n=2 Tax=Rhizobium leguminosarum TaxID=384 RepID=UPI0014427D1D|nr:cytochrome P460 family protein [Rhizobium leguminosarum]NKJ94694.1 hypothetical protein [Rhizobium leguminosarum bv. viciae]NKK87492.1 hypothetical protein [Rhizobium leguminosarum bv. viciae]
MKRYMWKLTVGPVVAGVCVALAAVLTDGEGASPVYAAANEVTFPPLDQLVHYTTVTRGPTREHMLTSREALGAIQAGQPVPVGTHVVLTDYQSDVLYRYLVSQKTGPGVDDWQFQWFWPDQSIKADENVAQCYSCHQRSRRERQFMFTFSDALSFK